ncbi:MAG: high-potential iron-sulfur protein [Lysobacteraceae bacterium]
MSQPIASRRRFLQVLGVAAVSVPLAGVAVRSARAQDLTPLDLSNPTAVALGYIEDTTKVDATKYPQHKPEQDCTNCQFYTATSGGLGSCQLFPGHSVVGKGWCASWAAKAG